MFLRQNHLNNFVNFMNTKHPKIQFTSEFEKNDFSSFLNVKITCSSNQLLSSVFSKTKFSGVLPI